MYGIYRVKEFRLLRKYFEKILYPSEVREVKRSVK